MVGRLFHVPVAYAAMLGHRDRVMNRFGSGEEYWRNLKTLPIDHLLMSRIVIRDAADGVPERSDLGDLRFVACAPIKTICGQKLGVLVIADKIPRPQFSRQELEMLEDLADVIAGKFELRIVASQSVDSRMRRDEAERRFQSVANAGANLIACYQDDGCCEYVNDPWLAYTGRSLQDELDDGWQQALHHGHRERFLVEYWQALQVRQPFEVKVPLLRHDGVFRWMRGSGTPRFLSDDSFAGFLMCLKEGTAYSK